MGKGDMRVGGHSVSMAHDGFVGSFAGRGSVRSNGHVSGVSLEDAYESLASVRCEHASGAGDGNVGEVADWRGAEEVVGSVEGGGSGVVGGGERAVLLATKMHVPAVGGQVVERVGLLEGLSAGRRRRLTLVSAPVGW